MIRCLIQAFIYDVWDICYSDPETSALSLQGTTLFERFLFLAERHCISEREVRYYSSRLNITPKYLSAICKKTSGKTASEWIEVFTIQQICVLLKNKNLSIKEISERMNFSTQSFFGRYVQRLLGVSPSEYRSVQENKI